MGLRLLFLFNSFNVGIDYGRQNLKRLTLQYSSCCIKKKEEQRQYIMRYYNLRIDVEYGTEKNVYCENFYFQYS